MWRSAAIASSRAVLRLVAASSRPSILYRPIANADPIFPRHLLLSIGSIPRSADDFSRSYARGRNLDHEEDFDDEEDDELDGEDFETEGKLDGEDFIDDIDEDDDDGDDDGESTD